MKHISVKEKLRRYLVENKGKVVTARQLKDVAAPAAEWARRVRELREEESWPILTHHDRNDLKPGEYLLDGEPPSEKPIKFKREVSQKLRAEVLDRNGFTCAMCGVTPGDIDEETGRKVRLHVGHIVDKSLGGRDELTNLRTLCSSCNQGAKNITTPRPDAIWLLAQVRRAGLSEQKAVLEWLQTKFGVNDKPDNRPE